MANPSNLCTLTGTIGKAYNRKQPNVFQFGIPVEDKFELSANNTFGIEVEVEGVLVEYSDDEFIDGVSPSAYCSGNVSKYGWLTKEDGSLRNGGVEFISMPTNGKHLYHVLDNLFKLIPKNTDFHPRAGIHVHVNCVDMSVAQVRRAILLYILFEPMFFSLVDKNRKKNIFCVPVESANAASDLLLLSTKRRKDSVQKYLALNIDTLYYYGTIEFRHLQSTNDLAVIGRWLKVIDNLFNFAKLSEDFDGLLQQVFNLTSNSQFDYLGCEVFGDMWRTFTFEDHLKALNNSVAMLKSAWVDEESSFIGPDLEEWLKVKGHLYFAGAVGKEIPSVAVIDW